MTNPVSLPSSAKIIIIGGGIVGCSTAYHLAKMGITDVLLLESGRLTSGSTWHAAGLVGQLRTNANITQLLGYSVALYNRLEAETELATGWRRNGGLRLACNNERWTEVKRQATTAKSFGLEMHLLTPSEAQKLWPMMQIDEASVRLVCSHKQSPAYEVHVHLVTPGPDVEAQARDHTFHAAFMNVMRRLRQGIGHRSDRRARHLRSTQHVTRQQRTAARRSW